MSTTRSSSLVVSPDKKSRKRKPKTKGSDLEDMLYLHILAARLPLPNREYLFAKPRKFRFDFAWPKCIPPVAFEVEGGIWTGGRHIRPAGFVKDLEKYNLANLLGFHVYRVTSKMVRDGTALTLIEQALATHSPSLSS